MLNETMENNRYEPERHESGKKKRWHRTAVVQMTLAYRNGFILQIPMQMHMVHGTADILEYGFVWHKQVASTNTRFFTAIK